MGNCCAPDGCHPWEKTAGMRGDAVGDSDASVTHDASVQAKQTKLETIAVVGKGGTGWKYGSPKGNNLDDGFVEQQYRTVEVVVQKKHREDELNIDVKHVWGRLVVHKIFGGGAVDRANQDLRRRGLDSLEIGDVIVEINGKSSDATMVKECQQQTELRIIAYRRPYAEEAN
eukprot:TRINITY_DN113397_c0_g1_i1.p1 TRINITY_DN113397_c0_g1~~TRINITY_DN113397_c0_g1_i1.p1  ORF type:complete len:172 (-),score=55.35 TRINITY_DN113397_c0_g1_i1:139-654(-)